MLAYTDPASVLAFTIRPLWYHVRGLSQTASGYGSKLTTRYCILYRGANGRRRWRRVYVSLWSNVGTAFIIDNGKRLIIDTDTEHQFKL